MVVGSRDQKFKKGCLLYITTQNLFAVYHNANAECIKYCILMYMYCTYSDNLCYSHSAGKCAGSSYHDHGVGVPCNQFSDGGRSGSWS